MLYSMYLNFTIKSSFFNDIDYWMWGDFRKQFRHEGQSNTEKMFTSIWKGNTMKQDMLNSQIHYRRIQTKKEQNSEESKEMVFLKMSLYNKLKKQSTPSTPLRRPAHHDYCKSYRVNIRWAMTTIGLYYRQTCVWATSSSHNTVYLAFNICSIKNSRSTYLAAVCSVICLVAPSSARLVHDGTRYSINILHFSKIPTTMKSTAKWRQRKFQIVTCWLQNRKLQRLRRQLCRKLTPCGSVTWPRRLGDWHNEDQRSTITGSTPTVSVIVLYRPSTWLDVLQYCVH